MCIFGSLIKMNVVERRGEGVTCFIEVEGKIFFLGGGGGGYTKGLFI